MRFGLARGTRSRPWPSRFACAPSGASDGSTRPACTSFTASALNSGVNFLLFLFAMNSSWRIFAPSGVSTKPGEDHSWLGLRYRLRCVVSTVGDRRARRSPAAVCTPEALTGISLGLRQLRSDPRASSPPPSPPTLLSGAVSRRAPPHPLVPAVWPAARTTGGPRRRSAPPPPAPGPWRAPRPRRPRARRRRSHRVRPWSGVVS
jgi:hypothetical protein